MGCLHPLPLEGVGLCLWGGRRCPPSPPSTWMDPRLLLLLHHLPHQSPPSPFICYDDCEDDDHCSDCGKCAVLCQEHHGCDCCGEEGLDITFHCAVCCCGRSLEGQYCKLKDLLSPEAFQTA